jgi:hypothetical protein
MAPRILRGIVHVHSHYSYDGKHSLLEIAQAARQIDLDFVCMTEHSDTLDPDKVARFAGECEAQSSAEFLMIPGIEFTCQDNLHLLGIGLKSYKSSPDPVEMNEFIQEEGGISVIAHPLRKNYQMPPTLLSVVNGIEIWNVVYDGRFFPNPMALDLYSKARLSNLRLVAFLGRDLHRLRNFHQTFIQLDDCELEQPKVLDALRRGRFQSVSSWYRISATPNIGPLTRFRLRLQQEAYRAATSLRGLLSR